MSSKRFSSFVALSLLASGVARAQIVNGDFSAGLTGWTVVARDQAFSGTIPSDPFVTVTTVGGAPAVKMENGTYDQGLGEVSLSQSFTVDAGAPRLQFDFTLPAVFPDSTGAGGSSSDLFQASIQPNGDLFLINREGNNLLGPGPLNATVTPSVTAGFDRTLTADLTLLIGQSVTLIFSLSQSDDSFYFDPNVSNIAMTPVPEPAHASLAAGLALAGAWAIRRRINTRA